MRKTAEADDDLLVAQSVVIKRLTHPLLLRGGRGDKSGKKIDRALLQLKILRVFEGEVKEGFFKRGEPGIETLSQPGQADFTRPGITGERCGLFSINVPRKLVEKHDKGEGGAGGVLPTVVLATGGKGKRFGKVPTNKCIGCPAAAEPELQPLWRDPLFRRQSTEPEIENSVRGHPCIIPC